MSSDPNGLTIFLNKAPIRWVGFNAKNAQVSIVIESESGSSKMDVYKIATKQYRRLLPIYLMVQHRAQRDEINKRKYVESQIEKL